MKNILILYTLILVGVGCGEKSQLSKEISLFQKSPVILPERCKMMFNVSTGVVSNSVSTGLKYVIYNDSLGCTSCAINKMYLWNDFIEYAKPYNGRLKYYFIYSPSKKDRKGIELILKKSNFGYPILLDTLNEFAKLNPHLPKNRVLHTFLLDEDNKVILVGNPLHNKKIEEMFYKIVEEKLGKSQQSSAKED